MLWSTLRLRRGVLERAAAAGQPAGLPRVGAALIARGGVVSAFKSSSTAAPPRRASLTPPERPVRVALPHELMELRGLCRRDPERLAIADSPGRLLELVDRLGGALHGQNRNERRLEKSVYRTRVHQQLYAELQGTAGRLSSDGFRSRGTSAFALMGPRGTGKTTALTSALYVLPLMWDNVIPVYVDFSQRTATVQPLHALVAEALKVAGIHVTNPDVDCMAEDLLAANRFVVLMVDDLDTLYELDPYAGFVPPQDGQKRPAAVQTLWDLANLADQNSGRFATIVCGSSALLPELLYATLKSNAVACLEHKLIPHSIDLNDTKVRTRRLDRCSPKDLETVARMLRLPTNGYERVVRPIALATGAVARAFAQLTNDEKSVSDLVAASLDGNDPRAARRPLGTTQGKLWRGIMRCLHIKNAVVVKELRDALKGLNPAAVSEVAWEKRLAPLMWSDIALCASSAKLGLADDDLSVLVDHICDRGYLAYDHTLRAEGPGDVYPYSMLQLVVFEAPQSDYVSIVANTATLVKGALSDAARIAPSHASNDVLYEGRQS